MSEGRRGSRRIPCLPPPPGTAEPGGASVGAVGAETGHGAVSEALVVGPGGGDLAGFAEALAGAVQHRVSAGPVQRLFGVGDEGSRVGAQGLREGGVAFERGPGRGQGAGGGAGELGVLMGREGVAGGTLDELVDADGLVGDAGGVVDEAEPVPCA
ncbi:hypothetical protein ACF061_38425 [Streptomyces sp. NPDC015220]|uniref:hypothetical protein n=1 Tax=Streptomyces sp. NPDC015220 TaxID=3364947 RepID=UPI0036F67332